MEYVYMYTVYLDIGLVVGDIDKNVKLIEKNKQITTQRDIILLKKMQHLGVPIFPMTKDNFERYKEIFLNLSLNNPLLYMMFITKTIKDQIATEIKVLNIGYIKSFESQKAAYADIYNIEENTFRKLYQHRCPVYPANKPEN